MLTREEKQKIINDFKINENDTGSSAVQVAVLTAEINDLKSHFDANKKDFSSRRGLMRKITRRRDLLKYLKRTDEAQYFDVIKRLNLRK